MREEGVSIPRAPGRRRTPSAVPGVFYSFDEVDGRPGRITWLTEGVKQLWGFEPEPLAQNPWLVWSRLVPEDRTAMFRRLAEARDQRLPCALEFRFEHPEGDQRWCEIFCVPELQPDGIVRWYNWAHDISSRRRSESLPLVQSSDIHNAMEPIVWLSEGGYFKYLNAPARQLLGLPEGDIRTLSRESLILDGEPGVWELLIRRVRAEGTVFFSNRRRLSTGRNIDIEGWASQLIFDGEPYISIVFRDVTERNRLQERLRLYAAVFESSHAAMAVFDHDGRIVDANPAYAEQLSTTREALIGMRLEDARPNDVLLSVNYAAVWRQLSNKGVWRGEIDHQRRDGERGTMLLTASVLRNAAGEQSHIVATSTDITPLKEQQRRLERMAHYDALTGLPNRVLFADRLELALRGARRRGRTLAVCYLDLDGFKPVNDRWGHRTGDALLVEIAQRLRSTLRDTDTVARLGGDEFVLLLGDLADAGEGLRLLNRLLSAIAEPVSIAPGTLQVSASIGVTLFPDDDSDAETLLRHADEAMYLAKRSGRNCYALFDAEVERGLRTAQRMFREFDTALRRGELCLHVEPKVNMRLGRVIGAEALLRWHHPQRGLLLPSQFLPYIENTDLVEALGQWLFLQARAQLLRWERLGLYLPLSINIAPRHLHVVNFAAQVEAALGDFLASRPRRIEFEIVETSLLRDLDRLAETMNECMRIGVSFALDDFGTGHSSLSYLRRLPAQTLKIDRSFVSGVLDNQSDRALVSGLVGLASNFGHTIVAEGIESRALGSMLLSLGCDCAQGYAIAPPMVPEAFPAWVVAYESGVGGF